MGKPGSLKSWTDTKPDFPLTPEASYDHYSKTKYKLLFNHYKKIRIARKSKNHAPLWPNGHHGRYCEN